MGLIGTLVTFAAGGRIKSTEVNANFSEIKTKVNATGMFTDVARTVTAVITFAAGTMIFAATGDVGTQAAPARAVYATGLVSIGIPGTVVGLAAGAPRLALPNNTGQVVFASADGLSYRIALHTDTQDNLYLGQGDPSPGLGYKGQIIVVGWTTGTVGASGGDVVLPNDRGTRGTTSAGTNTRALVKLTAGDAVGLGSDGLSVISIGAPPTISGAAVGDVVLGNGKWLRSVNGAGSATRRVLAVGSSDEIYLGLDSSIVLLGGTTVLGGAAAGDVIISNNRWLRAGNVAGTTGKALIGLDTNDAVHIAADNSVTAIGQPASLASAGTGEVVLANNKALRGVNTAGTDTKYLIHLSQTTDAVYVGYGGGGTQSVVAIGTPASLVSASGGDVVIANAKALRSTNAGGSDTVPLIGMQNTDEIQIGSGGNQNVKIGRGAAASLSTAAGARDGSIVLDTTNNRFVYYVGGLRFFLTGTSF